MARAASSSSRARTKTAADRRKETESRKRVTSIEQVPIGDNGVPMAKISFGASDLVPTGDYANVIIGPVLIERYVIDDGDESLAEAADKLGTIAETVLFEHRQVVLTNLQAEAEEKLNNAK